MHVRKTAVYHRGVRFQLDRRYTIGVIIRSSIAKCTFRYKNCIFKHMDTHHCILLIFLALWSDWAS